ncbi:hypothetical protein HDV00_001574 [Rhizophlyctis rosea]|nr:hypothetical protein HDV00_001574 [Rhizophlyctis rosea]
MWNRLRSGGPKPANQERFKLKYFRLHCFEIDRTIDFYQSLGMSVDWRADQTTNNGEVTPIVAMSYRAASGDPTMNVQLIFELSKQKQSAIISEDPDSAEEPRKKPISQEYLVIYVHLVGRLVKRLMAKDFEVVLPPIDVADVKVGIVRDPSGLDIRLMELTDSQLNETSNRKQWFARLGYYALPTSHVDDCIRFYEGAFSSHRGKTSTGKKATTLDIAQTPGSRGGGSHMGMGVSVTRKKPGAAATLRQAITQGQGFRLVDTEDFIIGLSHTVYHWLGNDLRSTSCTICFTERSVADSTTKEPVDRSDSLLVAFGFEVPGIESSVNQLRYEHRDALEWVTDRFKLAGIGTMVRFQDHFNNIFCELFATKAETPATAKGATPAAPGTEGADGTEAREGIPHYAIDFNHLKGHARTLSEGAVYRIRDPNEEISPPPGAELKPKEEDQPKTLKARTLLDARASAESLTDSGSTLNLSITSLYGKKDTDVKGAEGKKEGKGGKSVKVKFNFNRPKSMSAAW